MRFVLFDYAVAVDKLLGRSERSLVGRMQHGHSVR